MIRSKKVLLGFFSEIRLFLPICFAMQTTNTETSDGAQAAEVTFACATLQSFVCATWSKHSTVWPEVEASHLSFYLQVKLLHLLGKEENTN